MSGEVGRAERAAPSLATGRGVELYASLLNCDVGRLAEQAAEIEESGAVDGLHVDVMDGHFVPNLAFGPQSVLALRDRTQLPIEVHLMVERPNHLLNAFAQAGAQRLIVHAEACPQLHRDVQTITDLGALAGVALNPATPLATIDSIVSEIDEILLMGVDPGFGGQAFIESVGSKIAAARLLIDARGLRTKINIDGGVKVENARRLFTLGADRLVAGSALFEPPSIRSCADRMRASLGGPLYESSR